MSIFKTEHPKPQFMRKNWVNLNGKWQFEIDNGRTATQRNLHKNDVKLKDEIIVPFCPVSELSGIGNKDFMFGVVYKREFEITKENLGNVIKLHFGGADYRTMLYINETYVGEHIGGQVSFSFDITKFVKLGTNTVAVIIEDDTRDFTVPSGKQSWQYYSFECLYTRTTGIWQTVWLEFLPKTHIESVKFNPNINDCSVTVTAALCGSETLTAEVFYKEKKVGEYTSPPLNGNITFNIALSEKHLWEPGNGRLYDVEFKYGDDKVKSYFGLREVGIQNHKFILNGKSVFQRLVLDQGFYPDGIYTAKCDTDIERDIDISMAMGFNGARLHQKIFEERFLYYCDKKGYMVWGEFPSWGSNAEKGDAVCKFISEWLEEVNRDFNHPAIIGWCPYNEVGRSETSYNKFGNRFKLLYNATKATDPTRPCIDSSGWSHIVTDIYDVHDYTQDPEDFKKHYDELYENKFESRYNKLLPFTPGMPMFVSEYGGTSFAGSEGWGYGDSVNGNEEFLERFKALTYALLDNKYVCGFCYTQLYDVEQEQNGLYTYNREPKVEAKKIFEIVSKKAAIED